MLSLKTYIIIILSCYRILAADHVNAGWLIDYAPEYKAKIIDIETREPIEGAVVMAVYSRRFYHLAGSSSDSYQVKEAVTDSNGIFKINRDISIVGPFAFGDDVRMFIFKPGFFGVSGQVPMDEIYGNYKSGPTINKNIDGKSYEIGDKYIALEKWEDTPGYKYYVKRLKTILYIYKSEPGYKGKMENLVDMELSRGKTN